MANRETKQKYVFVFEKYSSDLIKFGKFALAKNKYFDVFIERKLFRTAAGEKKKRAQTNGEYESA